jgi:hypothetical protein
MLNSALDIWFRSCGAGLVAASLMAAPARSSAYSCHVPRALLCEGCASHIAIALQSDGTCRITFSPGTEAAATLTASEPIEFTVAGPPISVPLRRTTWRAGYVSLARPASTTRCFVFNAQKYCE